MTDQSETRKGNILKHCIMFLFIAVFAAGMAGCASRPPVQIRQVEIPPVTDEGRACVQRCKQIQLAAKQLVQAEYAEKARERERNQILFIIDLRNLHYSTIDADYRHCFVECGGRIETRRAHGSPAGLISQLESNDRQAVRAAAMQIYRSKSFDPEVLHVVNTILRRDYNNRWHADAMAWLCKILGAAGDPQYLNTLRLVAETSRIRKVRNHAARSLSLL